SDTESALLRRLSAFAGGFTLEAAEAVCAGEGLEAAAVLDVLASLVDKSLVAAEEQGREERYRLLETIRQYAPEKLFASGEAERLRDRHLEFFLAMAEAAEPKLKGRAQHEWLERLEMEHDNLRAALDWGLSSGQAEAGLRMAGALSWFWGMCSYFSE